MKKLISVILIIFLAYILSYYTVGKQKGYKFAKLDINLEELFQNLEKETVSENENFKLGMNAFFAKDYETALEYLTEAVYDDYGNFEANYYKGLSYYHLGDYKNAYTALEETVAYTEMPHDSAYYYMGICSYFEKYYSEASTNLYTYLTSNENDTLAYYYMALAYYEQDNYQLAIDNCTEAIERSNFYKEAIFDRGRFYIINGEYRKAVNDYVRLFRDYNDYVAYFNCGLAYEYLLNYDSAMYCYKKSIELEPNYARSNLGVGDMLVKNNKYNDALEYYNKAIELNPDYHYSYISRGDLYIKTKQYNEAIPDYIKVLEYDDDNTRILYNLAVCYDNLKMNEEAIYAYKNYFNYADNSDKNFQTAVDRLQYLESN